MQAQVPQVLLFQILQRLLIQCCSLSATFQKKEHKRHKAEHKKHMKSCVFCVSSLCFLYFFIARPAFSASLPSDTRDLFSKVHRACEELLFCGRRRRVLRPQHTTYCSTPAWLCYPI